VSLAWKADVPAETRNAPPMVWTKMIIALPVGMSICGSVAWTAETGTWKPRPSPRPTMTWYPIHAEWEEPIVRV